MGKWEIFDKKTFDNNAIIYKIMSNPIRLEILNRLRVRDHTVEELTKILNLRKANASQHLAILRQSGIIVPIRNGQNVYYCLKHPKIVEACKILKEVSEQVTTI